MINFLTLEMEGFCSYVNPTKLDLNHKNPVIIKAPNGSGKTTIFSAISWCLYGKTLKDTSNVNTWDKLRTKAYKGTKVVVYFQSNGKLYQVTRCQNYKGKLDDGAIGKDRLILREEADLVDIKGKSQLQNYIIEKLGLSFKVFTSSILFGQGLSRLIDESNSDKKKIFDEIFNLNFINLARDIATNEYNEISKDYKRYLDNISSKKIQLNQLNRFKIDTENNMKYYEDLRMKGIKKLKDKRKALTKDLIEVKKKFSEDKLLLVDTKLKRARNSLEDIKNKLADAKQVSSIPLIDLIDKVINLLKQGKIKKAIKEMVQIKTAFTNIEKYNYEKEEITDTLCKLQERKSALHQAERESNEIAEQISEIDNDILERSSKVSDNREAVDTYQIEIDNLNKEIKELEKKKSKLQTKLDNYSWLIKDPLSNNGIKAFLFDSSLHILNETLKSYSEILGFRISFEVDLELANKGFVTLIEKDNEIIDYADLSGGEKQLVCVAMAFAMNNSISSSQGINIAFCDEVFESLDSENIELVIALIKSVYEDRSLFLITHQNSLPLSVSKTLQVIKNQGRSELKWL